jgi:hypothetical protein
VFFDGGWMGEAEISYAGPNASAARLAMDVIASAAGAISPALRPDRHDERARRRRQPSASSTPTGAATDIRLRVAPAREPKLIDRMLREVTALWTGGPAAAAGAREQAAALSTILPGATRAGAGLIRIRGVGDERLDRCPALPACACAHW